MSRSRLLLGLGSTVRGLGSLTARLGVIISQMAVLGSVRVGYEV